MADQLMPRDIFEFLSQRVLGQDDVLQKIAVALFKHVNGLRGGNILMIGNSGTGKTTIMKAIRQFYAAHDPLQRFRAMTVMNANTLVDEAGEVNLMRIFKNLETEVRSLVGHDIDAATLKQYMETATVCFDEVDKISAKISGKPNVTGISIQQALLTVLEGENFLFETTVTDGDQSQRVKMTVDTSRMLFISGGAFEELYDQVYTLVENKKDDRRLKQEPQWDDEQGRIKTRIVFRLKEMLVLSDLFTYGMVPQFISRFNAIAILEDLRKEDLRRIMLTAEDSPLRHSRQFFATLDIDLDVTDEALDLIAGHAALNSRIGARALREVFSRIISPYEFNPQTGDGLKQEGDRRVIRVDREMVAGVLTG